MYVSRGRRGGREGLRWSKTVQDTATFYKFENIRYAAPPIGKLRFAEPQSPAKNRGKVQTGNVTRICPQVSAKLVLALESCIKLTRLFFRLHRCGRA